MRSYTCAICEREVEYEGSLPSVHPFCSERCRMVDLGKWLRGDYAVDRELTVTEIDPDALPPLERERL